jgi:hypothetical protein
VPFAQPVPNAFGIRGCHFPGNLDALARELKLKTNGKQMLAALEKAGLIKTDVPSCEQQKHAVGQRLGVRFKTLSNLDAGHGSK